MQKVPIMVVQRHAPDAVAHILDEARRDTALCGLNVKRYLEVPAMSGLVHAHCEECAQKLREK